MTDPIQACPLYPGGLCQSATASGCPGGEACARDTHAAIVRADAELARRKAAGEPPERWATTAAEFATRETINENDDG